MTGVASFAAVFAGLYAAHQVADHWVQTDHQAANKAKPGRVGRLACLAHVGTYTLTAVVALAPLKLLLGLELEPVSLVLGLLVSAVTHYVADRRFPLRKLAEATGHHTFVNLGAPRADHDDKPCLGTDMYALDQSFHIGWLFIASVIIAGGAA